MSSALSLKQYMDALTLPDGPADLILSSEAADLDSVVSSLVYAYCRNCCRHTSSYPVIPILREEIKLRKEVLRLFEEAGLDAGKLLFLDDAMMPDILSHPGSNITLIDHHQLPEDLGISPSQISLIIDHHDKQHLPPRTKRLIAPVGSTATLITELLLRHASSIIDQQTALLLAGTIVLDTACLDIQSGRCTPRDQEAAEALFGQLDVEKTYLYNILEQEKFSIEGLTSHQILHRDCKRFKTHSFPWALSTVPVSFEKWKTYDSSFPSAVRAYSSQLSCKFLGMIAAYRNGSFQRQLALFSPVPQLLDHLVNFFDKQEIPLQSFDPLAPHSQQDFCFFQLTDPAWSRKRIQPLLEEFFSDPSFSSSVHISS